MSTGPHRYRNALASVWRRLGGTRELPEARPPIETLRTNREIVLACLFDELDRCSAPRLLAAVQALDFEGICGVRLDLTRVKYADTALVAVLVLLSRSLSRPSFKLTVGPVSPAVEAILSLHHVSRHAEARHGEPGAAKTRQRCRACSP